MTPSRDRNLKGQDRNGLGAKHESAKSSKTRIVTMTNASELLPCPFCGGDAVIKLHRYQGTFASGMETPEPYAACEKGCVEMQPVRCDDWPYGRKAGLPTSKEARAQAITAWNTRQVTQLEAQLAEVREAKVTDGMLEAALQAHYGRDGWRWDDGLTEGMRLVYQTKMEAALTAALLTKEPK